MNTTWRSQPILNKNTTNFLLTWLNETVPNLEAKATDGNQVFTPRQWLERFRQFCKREHKIDITPLMKRRNNQLVRERTNRTRRFHMGCGIGSTLPNNQGRIQNGTR